MMAMMIGEPVELAEGIRERRRYLAALASQARMYRRRRMAGALTVIGVGIVGVVAAVLAVLWMTGMM